MTFVKLTNTILGAVNLNSNMDNTLMKLDKETYSFMSNYLQSGWMKHICEITFGLS